jgi:hypothetical protein
MAAETWAWWTLLRSAAVLNVVLWAAAAWALWRWRDRWPPQAWLGSRWQLLLSAGYVLGCGYRSLFPVFDVQRLVLVDSFWSSVLVGRSVATVAELCFAAQWALLLHAVSCETGNRSAAAVSKLILPLIAVAEGFSWHAVLSTSNLGHVVEESLWALCAAALVWSLVLMWPQVQRPRKPLFLLWCAAGSAYVAYMVLVDVPMYWQRWVADEALGRSYLGLAQGLADVSQRWVVSHDWAHWQTEVIWMTAYFSVAVWISIALVWAPRLLIPLGRQQAPTARVVG